MKSGRAACAWTAMLTSALLALSARVETVAPGSGVDVKEGETLRLQCRFSPSLASRNILYYWSRTNRAGKDNAAVNNVSLASRYSVEYGPNEGRYDLVVSRAQYDEDNGLFECRLKEAGSGANVFNLAVAVTVLLPPGEPRIIPNMPVAREGEPFALTCSSEGGSPDPTVQWYRDGALLQGQVQKGGSRDKLTSSVLTLTPNVDDDGTIYRCVVWNRALKEENKLHASTTLRVNYAPRVTVGPYNPLNVMSDGDAVLTCAVKANPPARVVRWMKGGHLLSNTYNHTIPAVTPTDTGLYTCVADNGVGEPTQANLQLSVLYGPKVSVVPHQEVALGELLTVKCNVASNPQPQVIQWVKEDDQFFRETGDTLRIAGVTAEDSGRYTCQVVVMLRPSGSSGQREISSNGSVTVRIRHKPGDAEILPSNPVAVAGKSFTLTCRARPQGWPLPEYRWWKESQEHQELEKRANYTLVSAHGSQEGRYFCQPQNSLGRGTIASVYLTVQEPSTVVIPLRPQMVKKDGDSGFGITCRARGKPKPKVRWLHNHQEIARDSALYKVATTETLEDNNAYSLLSTLTFEGSARRDGSLMSSDRGRYACEFENGFGQPASSEMMLRIEHPPVVRHTYNRVAFDLGENAVMQCKMQAFPEPSFDWTYGSRVLDDYGDYGTNVTDLGEDVYAGVLSVRNIGQEDYGEYTCRAWNKIGDDKKTIIKLVKKSAPDRPSNLEVVDVNSDRITLRWTEGFSGGFGGTEFIVTYVSLATGQAKNESCRTQNPCQVTGLHSKTEYRFKVLAVNPRGYSPYSEEISVATKVNLKDMPRALLAQYDKGKQQVYFRTEPTSLALLAKVEARFKGQGEWYLQKIVEIRREQERVSLPGSAEGFGDVRVILCLQSNESWCGDEKLAEPFDDSVPQALGTRNPLSTEHLIVIFAIAGGAFVIMVAVVVCCCWRKKGKKGKKDYEMETPNVRPKAITPPYYPDSVVGKGLDPNLDDINKHNIYSTGVPLSPNIGTGMNGHVPGSNHLSNGMMYSPDHDLSQCGNDSQSDLWVKSGGDLPPESTYHHYDTGLPNGYYYPEDYQTLPEDVMNMKNREHLHSPYYDVSGLPDPYALADEDKMQHVSLSFDESLESGYSTPNSRSRRVVREIIV